MSRPGQNHAIFKSSATTWRWHLLSSTAPSSATAASRLGAGDGPNIRPPLLCQPSYGADGESFVRHLAAKTFLYCWLVVKVPFVTVPLECHWLEALSLGAGTLVLFLRNGVMAIVLALDRFPA